MTQVAALLESSTEKVYEAGSTVGVTTVTSYEYSQHHMNPVSIKRTGNTVGEELITRYKYALDYYTKDLVDWAPTAQLIEKRINNLVETTEFIRKGGQTCLTYARIDDYAWEIYPVQTLTIKPNTVITDFKPSTDKGGTYLEKDPRYRLETRYRIHDKYSNCIERVEKDGTHTVTLWSYQGKYPVAVIRNVTYTEGQNQLGTTLIKGLSPKSAPTEDDFTRINALRNSLPGAEVSTYRYNHLVGVSQVTNPQGISTFYSYNANGQLAEMYIQEKDAGGKEIKRSQKYYRYEPYMFD